MKKIILIISLFLPAVYTIASDNAEAKRLMEHSQKILSLKNVHLEFNMETIEKRGRSKSKTLSVSFAEFGQEKKVMIKFESPENVKGTKILTTDYPDKKGIIEIYMPSTDKIQKIKANRNNMKIMGNKIPIIQFNKIIEADFHYSMLDRKILDGTECHKIKVEGSENSGDYGIAYISVKDEQLQCIERYDGKNNLISLTNLSDYMEVDGANSIFYPKKITSTNIKTGESSNMEVYSVEHLKTVDAKDFVL
jgi:hypothetical protein